MSKEFDLLTADEKKYCSLILDKYEKPPKFDVELQELTEYWDAELYSDWVKNHYEPYMEKYKEYATTLRELFKEKPHVLFDYLVPYLARHCKDNRLFCTKDLIEHAISSILSYTINKYIPPEYHNKTDLFPKFKVVNILKVVEINDIAAPKYTVLRLSGYYRKAGDITRALFSYPEHNNVETWAVDLSKKNLERIEELACNINLIVKHIETKVVFNPDADSDEKAQSEYSQMWENWDGIE